MKTKVVVKDITHEDIVNLLSTALYGSEWLSACYDKVFYLSKCDPKDTDCFEDKLAKVLLGGGYISLCDGYAEDEDEFYGDIEHDWDYECETMDYRINLETLTRGLERAAASKGWASDCFLHLMQQAGEFDYCEANCLIQWIMFGEEIYG